ncbi:hypothetical protein [Acaryochloris sp. IP29b_bin.137]|uniref:hypothetical protein n=1 Tax=Acaryochloris sp. IP29b_bin.137 TaxID=2969217 RepID=UPI0026119090|nr:hypothetical protein [Acaryochloris sp. IP29b_bin.137]
MLKYKDKISIEQAYLAAYEYLLRRWESTPEHRIADELSDMSLLADGDSADPACKSEFLVAVNAVLIAQSQTGGYTRAAHRIL